jgi:hypothetical protein
MINSYRELGGHVQPLGPAGIRGPVAEDPPGSALGCSGHRMQTPAELGWRPITLGVVTPGAGGNNILPEVAAAPAARQDVVDGLRRAAAVGAPAAVPSKDRPTGQADIRPVRHANISCETYHQRYRYAGPLAVEDTIAVGHADRLRGEYEDGGSADRHDP